jgi:NitT/TauT family transport system substrate-binding protein
MFLKKKVPLLLLSLLLIGGLIGCGGGSSTTSAPEEKIPELVVAWGSELHTGVMNMIVNRADLFADKPVHLNIIDAENYDLIQDGAVVAHLKFVLSKGGSEVATMFAQNVIDFGFSSNTAVFSAVDAGAKVKIVSPLQSDGIALVFPPGSKINNWESLKKHLQSGKEPVKIGYHSPVSAPRIALEYVLKEQGIKITQDPGDASANVLLVDLKGSSNLLPSLKSKVVDAWVGPSHYPEAAEVEGLGKIVLNLRDFPEAGQWDDFPCCVFSARQEIIDSYPKACQAMTQLVTYCAHQATQDRDTLAEVIFATIGIPQQAVKNARINFVTRATDKWFSDLGVYFAAMTSMGQFNGDLKGVDYGQARNMVIDTQFVEKVQR